MSPETIFIASDPTAVTMVSAVTMIMHDGNSVLTTVIVLIVTYHNNYMQSVLH